MGTLEMQNPPRPLNSVPFGLNEREIIDSFRSGKSSFFGAASGLANLAKNTPRSEVGNLATGLQEFVDSVPPNPTGIILRQGPINPLAFAFHKIGLIALNENANLGFGRLGVQSIITAMKIKWRIDDALKQLRENISIQETRGLLWQARTQLTESKICTESDFDLTLAMSAKQAGFVPADVVFSSSCQCCTRQILFDKVFSYIED